jgi:hypothetical protein
MVQQFIFATTIKFTAWNFAMRQVFGRVIKFDLGRLNAERVEIVKTAICKKYSHSMTVTVCDCFRKILSRRKPFTRFCHSNQKTLKQQRSQLLGRAELGGTLRTCCTPNDVVN